MLESVFSVNDSPFLVVYDDASVVARAQRGVGYCPSELNSEQFERLSEALGEARAASFQPEYFLGPIDGTENIIQYQDGRALRQVSVSGEWHLIRSETPEALRRLVDELLTLTACHAPAAPKAAELLLHELRVAPLTEAWPSAWPNPEWEPERMIWHAVLAGSLFDEALRHAQASADRGSAFTFGGRSFAVRVRAVLPGDPRILRSQ